MTPPHIETIARAMKRAEINKTVGILSPASIDAHVDASWKTCIPAATLVWSLAIEEAAKRADDEALEQHCIIEQTQPMSVARTQTMSKRDALRDFAISLRALAVEGE